MLIDTHAHVNFAAFKDDAEETIKRALNDGVNMVLVGTQIDTSRQAVELANKFDQGVYAAIGVHPVHTYSQHLDEEESSFQTREEKFNSRDYRTFCQNPKVVGIGECGLDYFRLPEEMKHEAGNMNHEQIKQLQKNAFIEQIKLAKELNKTLIIHSRSSKGTDDACLDILEIMKHETPNTQQTLRFVLHSYTGSPEVAKMFVDLGAYVSFNGIITFDKTGNQEAVLKVVPDDKIVLETDCPYLTPAPHRGKRNEPLYVQFVAQKVAQVKNLSIEKISELTTKNAKQLFNLTLS